MSPPSPNDLRIQLEGAWEQLEEAHALQSTLYDQLCAPRWKQRLREEPEPLRRVLERETHLAETLTRIEQQLQKHGCAENHPLHVHYRRFLTHRANLVSQVNRRLTSLGEVGGDSLGRGLALLEAYRRAGHSLSPQEGEVILFSDAPGRLFWVQLLFASVPFVLLSVIPLFMGGPPALSLVVLVFIAFALPIPLSEHGRLQLTQRRMIWRPFIGKPWQLRLDQIEKVVFRESTFARPQTQLQVLGPHPRTLPHSLNLTTLETLLALHLAPSLRGKFERPPTYPLALFSATRQQPGPGPERWSELGVAVLRARSLAFLPYAYAGGSMRFLVGFHPEKNFETLNLSLLLKSLSLLSEKDLDICLRRAVQDGQGVLWTAGKVVPGPATPEGQDSFSERGQVVLTCAPTAPEREAMNRVLAHWKTG